MTPSWPRRYEPGCTWQLEQRNGIGFVMWINGEPLSRKATPERQRSSKRVTHRGRGSTVATSQLVGPVRALEKFFAMLAMGLVAIGTLCGLSFSRSIYLFRSQEK
jgi:hypothetical protein